MTDLVRIDMQIGEVTDDWGSVIPVWSERYEGIGLVQADSTRPATLDSSGRVVILQEYIGKVPHTVTLEQYQRYRLMVIKSSDDGNLGEYTIIKDMTQGWASCRRLKMVRS